MQQHVKQNVLIADDLALQLQSVNARIAASAGKDMDLSALRGESKRLDAGIWDHLDTAAAQTHNAGRSTQKYAALRSAPDTSPSLASAALKAAWPEIDWTPPAPFGGMGRPRGFLSRLFGR
jgi:hypothetical protein